MSKGIDIEFVREYYKKMSDEEVMRITTEDAAGMTPEAQEVIREEIHRRNLDKNLLQGIVAQNKSYTINDLNTYCDLIQELNCPSCQTSSEKLNGTMTGEVISVVFFTQYRKKLKIACPHCLDKANNTALTKSAILGWWGIPWGIIKTIQSITLNQKAKATNHLGESNDYLRSFVISNIGQIETYKEDKNKLQILISQN